ncbi:LysR family transcriptional regulator [Nitrincola nitratireducens]|uniref:Uncharacterized protein n=1 Tax=Nitrincola nitratireducens TaxID=1229521 RepID=W9V497_9GAMM|nr:LysR family transcriptional regulator [Nitrincola nitratireducens]EXJ10942.1 hypothetical protein D791_02040 [Nitrincola nitratireducens]
MSTRGPRHLEVTSKGMELLVDSRRMLELQLEAREPLFGPKLSGMICIGVPDGYAMYLTPVLRSFAGRHPGVDIELTCEQLTSHIPCKSTLPQCPHHLEQFKNSLPALE